MRSAVFAVMLVLIFLYGVYQVSQWATGMAEGLPL